LLADAVQDKSIPAWKLVSSLRELIALGRSDRTYPKWSDRFLSFCERSADATAQYLKEQAVVAVPEETTTPPLRRSSAIIKVWELLHSFIKPVLDADNLKVPYPLVQFLTEHVGELSAVSGAKLVIEISPQLTYYQHQHTSLRRAVLYLQAIVNGPPIEERLGFLALPCLQSKSLFMNCLLYHEVGHFIAEETTLLSPVERVELHDELRDAFRKYSQHEDPEQREKNLYWAMQTLEQLMEELFADLIAVRLVGLAYTLSYMELLRLADLSPEEFRAFYIDHPADALRFREQLKALEDDGWDEYGANLPHWKQLTSVAGGGDDESHTPSDYYFVPSDYRDDEGMSEFWRILIDHLCRSERIGSIHTKVNTLLADRKDNPFDRHREFGRGIEECLSHGIVPSREADGSMPHPLAVINGGVIFLLSKMDDLHTAVQGGPPEFIAKRAFLESRVEMWCLKAIEDWLVRRQQESRGHSPES
jgi:hypothetical protein